MKMRNLAWLIITLAAMTAFVAATLSRESTRDGSRLQAVSRARSLMADPHATYRPRREGTSFAFASDVVVWADMVDGESVLTAYDTRSGKQVWRRHETRGFAVRGNGGSGIVGTDENGEVHALNASSGNDTWRLGKRRWIDFDDYVLTNEHLILNLKSGQMESYDLDDGRLEWSAASSCDGMFLVEESESSLILMCPGDRTRIILDSVKGALLHVAPDDNSILMSAPGARCVPYLNDSHLECLESSSDHGRETDVSVLRVIGEDSEDGGMLEGFGRLGEDAQWRMRITGRILGVRWLSGDSIVVATDSGMMEIEGKSGRVAGEFADSRWLEMVQARHPFVYSRIIGTGFLVVHDVRDHSFVTAFGSQNGETDVSPDFTAAIWTESHDLFVRQLPPPP